MLFNSLTFLVFFATLLISYHFLMPSWRSKKILLLIASYLFYAAWNPPFVILLWLSTVIDWICASRIDRTEHQPTRRAFLILSLLVNLGLLGYFKYGGFVLDNFTAILHAAGISYSPAKASIVLPVGISFYTFQTLSYTLDVYLRRAKPAASMLDFALYVTFFPQLVAGPIVRATDFLPQCRESRPVSGRLMAWGLFLMILGLFEKVVLADGFVSGAAETVFKAANPVHALDAWIGVLGFSSQIFCDFAGYSTCAIGAALCFGFFLPDNFRFPYAAIGFSDFWRRWHISLSTWLRDYLYIPLGGNRQGTGRTYFNLMMTMLLGGLWHGASWTFVVWGGLHGIYLSVERFLTARFRHATWVKTLPAQFVFALLTYFLVLITWVFFRAQNFHAAWQLLGAMFGQYPKGDQILATFDIVKVLVVTLGILSAHWLCRKKMFEEVMTSLPAVVLVPAWAVMLVLVTLMQGGGNAFIYFQF